MIISDKKVPKIEAKVKSEVKGGIRGTTPVVTVRIPKPNNSVSAANADDIKSRTSLGRNSPMTDSKGLFLLNLPILTVK